jgi:chaperone BCS1
MSINTVELRDCQQRAFLKYLGKKWNESNNSIDTTLNRFSVVHETDESFTLIPSFGEFQWTHKGGVFDIVFSEEGKPVPDPNGGITYFHRLVIKHADVNLLREFVSDALETVKNDHEKKVMIYRGHSKGFWESHFSIYAQKIDNVYLPAKIKESLITRIDSFMADKERYIDAGRSHKIGFLLTGIPGSGKTSLIKAIALKYKRPIYTLNFSKTFSDEGIISLMSEIKDNSILVIEDIDSYFQHRKALDINIGFSCLLNMLDGTFNKGCGLIVFLTANNPQNLDPALIRPGRIDKIFKFDYPLKADVNMLFKDMVPGATDEQFANFWKQITRDNMKIPMCAIIDFLFRHQAEYINHIDELITQNQLLKSIENDKTDILYG